MPRERDNVMAQGRNDLVTIQYSTWLHLRDEPKKTMQHQHDRGFVVPALTPGAR